MKISLCCCLAAGLSFAAAGRADEPPIIAEARAYVGSEAALDGLKSVHLVGRMAVETPGDPAKGATAQIDIIFQKPWRECVTVVSSEGILRTALDGYDGWHLEQRLEPGQAAVFDPHRVQQLTILDPERVKGLRTDTWENLSYYRGLEAAGGRIEDQGPATVDGVACEKVALIHSADTIYYRYFDQATGRLVYSETVKGAKIRERGEIVAGGIRFAKTIDVLESQGGKDRATTMTIDKVTVNEVFPESLFSVPLPPLPLGEVNPGGLNVPAVAPATAPGSVAAPGVNPGPVPIPPASQTRDLPDGRNKP
jgi:hypothetical protein